MSEYRLRVAEAIVAARESVDVSQRELADRLGRDKRTIQKWEKGEMKIALEAVSYTHLTLPTKA